MSNFNVFIDPKTKKKLIHSSDGLITENGKTKYPIIKNIPRFVGQNLYEDSVGGDTLEEKTGISFGKKWREKTIIKVGTQSNFEKNTVKEQFRAMLGCETDEKLTTILLNSKKTLNGGCGTAWSEYLFNVNPQCERHCVDLSLSVETAYENTKEMENVTISQASILELPYPENFFDIVYSDGVVHHTPDPKQATIELGKRVKKGGVLGIYIYNKKPFLREMADNEIRKHTTKMSYEDCREFSRKISLLGKSLKSVSNQPLVIQEDIPLLNIKAGSYDLQKFIYDHFIKCWYNPEASIEFANLCNLDWYHPSYASHHEKKEIFEWFEEAGFSKLKCIQPKGWEHSGYFISGIR